VQKVSPQLLSAMIDGLEEHPERATVAAFQQLGGAIARVSADATAFPFRNVHATALLVADWPATADPAPHLEALRRYWATIAPYTYGFYTNDAVEESQKQVDDNYLENYPRLRKLKDKYDPTNLFRLNANVRPVS
jgi:FAD/FMN-containing dehydrogenase